MPRGRALSTKDDFWLSQFCKRCPDTPSDGFVSPGPQDQSVALFLSQITYLPLCVKALFYSVRNYAPLFNGGKTFWLVMMSLR